MQGRGEIYKPHLIDIRIFAPKMVKQVGAVDYCYAEYDPNKDSESYVKVEKTHRFIKGFFEILF